MTTEFAKLIAGAGSVQLRAMAARWSLASASLAMESWCLIGRACFSLITAQSRSRRMHCGSYWRLTAVAMSSSKAAVGLMLAHAA